MKDLENCDDGHGTEYCKHKSTCVQNVLKGSVQTLKWSFMIKYAISKLFRIKQMKRHGLLEVLFSYNGDTVIFSAILTMISATYKTLLCLARKYSSTNPDKWAAPLAALISGFWLNFDPEAPRRNLLMILIIAKAVDCVINITIRKLFGFNKPDDK